MAPKAFLAWSSGKDCAFALVEARRLDLAEIVGVFTTINEDYDRVVQHGTRHSLLDQQLDALGLPCIKVGLPAYCSMDMYEQRTTEAYRQIKATGIDRVVFGDLFLENVRTARDALLAKVGMIGIYPLWMRDTAALAERMIDAGLVAHVVCLDPLYLPRSLAGRQFDRTFLQDLPRHVDPCGENGEFHTAVSAGPMFNHPIAVEVGAVVDRGGFIFADLREA
jgi:uncharacterized protein (TIGR00290 family)